MKVRSGELSASIAVLALVVEQSDSVSGVSRRLVERYPDARFARSVAHVSLPQLEQQGLVRRIEVGTQGSECFEATSQGVRRVQGWLQDSSTALPVLRDDLRAKLRHVQDERDLGMVLDAVKAQEGALTAKFAEAHTRLRAAERANRVPGEEPNLKAVVDLALLRDEATLWGTLLKRRQRLREYLEGWKDAGDGGLDG